MDINSLSTFVKIQRKAAGLTQIDLAAKAGVGIRFVRDMEQGKATLRTDTVNKVLWLFGEMPWPRGFAKRIKQLAQHEMLNDYIPSPLGGEGQGEGN